LLQQIRRRANELDATGAWPGDDLDVLAGAGAMRSAIPREFGGDDRSAMEIHLLYERIASASLSVALILSPSRARSPMRESRSCLRSRAI
jgi:alkylation response protein AidB-like acyl-CoA dehydrogenase